MSVRVPLPAATIDLMPSPLPSADTSADASVDASTTIDEALQVLFSCCLSLCRASRDTEHKDDLISATIEDLDRSIRLLRSTPA